MMEAKPEQSIRKTRILEALENEHVSLSFDDPLENEMILNMGPQHPATHGVLRLLIKLDGETVLASVPDLGYLHRGYEKLAENCSYHEYIPHTDRLDYLSPLSNNVAYILAVEKLLGIEATPRAQYIRTLICELARISSHLMFFGSLGMDVGALTVWMWTFREREKLYDIFETITGARFTTSYTRIGGLAQDVTAETLSIIRNFINELPDKVPGMRETAQHEPDISRPCGRRRLYIEGTGDRPGPDRSQSPGLRLRA